MEITEKDKQCAPHIRFDNYSCIELSLLIEMVNAYNETHSDKIQVDSRMETINPTKYKLFILKQFERKFAGRCKTQKCWTEQDFIMKIKEKSREELLKFTFRPDGPQGKWEWLNTININDVMEQYERVYKDFKFLGAVPMDFDKISILGVKDLNFSDQVKNGKTKLGIIFNLDKHNQPGSHWVSMFSDLKNGYIYFYDSYATQPTDEIRILIRRIYRFCESNNIKNIKCEHNKIRHQYGGSECGVYSINFILRLLNGDTFEKICNDKTPDKEINKMRKVYFY